MPKILSYTPPWLSRPAAGAKIFTDPAPQSPVSPSKRVSYFGTSNGGTSTESQGPKRLLARRGTEIFTVVGNKLRWADLSAVKSAWEELGVSGKRINEHESGPREHEERLPYRTLAVPVYYQIRQLIISPSGVFLAICTEHTVHIAVLPDPSRLKDKDQSPLKLKTYQLGPTTHVIPESPIVCALWHPLAVTTNSSDCLVTVTAEAAVRVWELDRSNQWSFEKPALAIDLKKLADGVSCDEDFEPSGFGKSRGFSVDAFDMEASAACFGGQGQAEEDPWASMTLWTAMRNGDVYALCPLIPSKWAPSSTTIPSLSTKAVSNAVTVKDYDTDPEAQRTASQQYEWVQEIDSEEQATVTDGNGGAEFEIRHRPTNPSAIPRLQGPFEIRLEDDFADLEVSDICVLPAKLDEDELLSGEDDYGDSEVESIEGLPFSLLCLATTNGQVYICMDLEGVSGQWLPQKGRSAFAVPESDTKELELIDIFSVTESAASDQACGWPLVTRDSALTHGFFLTTEKHIHSISFSDWYSKLGPELLSTVESDAGLPSRLIAACQEKLYAAEELLSLADESADPDDVFSAPVYFDEPGLGLMLVTSTPSKAYTLSFDQHRDQALEERGDDLDLRKLIMTAPPTDTDGIPTLRAPYQTPLIFFQSSTAPLKKFLTGNVPQQTQQTLRQQIKLSPATLEVMSAAHRILSSQTSQLERAAAELFRRCQRMRDELNEQVKQMSELADRLQHLSGDDAESRNVNEKLDGRIAMAHERQKKFMQKYEELRRKTGRASNASRGLSTKEVAWAAEVQEMSQTFGLDGTTITADREAEGISGRFQAVKKVAEELLEEAKSVEKFRAKDGANGSDADGSSFRRSGSLVSSRLQKEKISDVMAMVEREGAVIDAVMARLDRLNVGH